MARPRRENPLLVLLIFLILAAGIIYFLILVWEIPSPVQTNVRCEVPYEIFLGENVPDDQVCRPS